MCTVLVLSEHGTPRECLRSSHLNAAQCTVCSCAVVANQGLLRRAGYLLGMCYSVWKSMPHVLFRLPVSPCAQVLAAEEEREPGMGSCSVDLLHAFWQLVGVTRTAAALAPEAPAAASEPQQPLTPWPQLPAARREQLLEQMLNLSDWLMLGHVVLLIFRTALSYCVDCGDGVRAAAAAVLRREVAEVQAVRTAVSISERAGAEDEVWRRDRTARQLVEGLCGERGTDILQYAADVAQYMLDPDVQELDDNRCGGRLQVPMRRRPSQAWKRSCTEPCAWHMHHQEPGCTDRGTCALR